MAIQILNCVIGANSTDIHKYLLQKYVAPLFNVRLGDPRYDVRVDINQDGVIDGKDIAMFSKDAQLTAKTFGITPLLWYQVVLPLGLGLVGVAALVILKKR